MTFAPPDEFDWISRLRPLTRGVRSALGLLDDAAVIAPHPGQDLVISQDAMVEGVHVLAGEAPEIIARRLLRTSLSDLAAKAAEPFGYFLMTAWPPDRDMGWRERFIGGLRQDGERFAVALLGGDTVATLGPLAVSATVLGWAPTGECVLRSGARPGDALMVCGVIGDGWLGLKAARGELADKDGALAAHFRTPEPLLGLRAALRRYAHAAIDVSDGLLADVQHLAEASGVAATVELDRMPLSEGAGGWLAGQSDPRAACSALACGGDDYAIACAVAPRDASVFAAQAGACGAPIARVGYFEEGSGLRALFAGSPVEPLSKGWRH